MSASDVEGEKEGQGKKGEGKAKPRYYRAREAGPLGWRRGEKEEKRKELYSFFIAAWPQSHSWRKEEKTEEYQALLLTGPKEGERHDDSCASLLIPLRNKQSERGKGRVTACSRSGLLDQGRRRVRRGRCNDRELHGQTGQRREREKGQKLFSDSFTVYHRAVATIRRFREERKRGGKRGKRGGGNLSSFPKIAEVRPIRKGGGAAPRNGRCGGKGRALPHRL